MSAAGLLTASHQEACYVLRELAHRQGDELLLWDGWGQMAEPGPDVDADTAALPDDVAATPARS